MKKIKRFIEIFLLFVLSWILVTAFVSSLIYLFTLGESHLIPFGERVPVTFKDALIKALIGEGIVLGLVLSFYTIIFVIGKFKKKQGKTRN